MIPPAKTRYGRGRVASIRSVSTWRRMKPQPKDVLEFVKGHHKQWKIRYYLGLGYSLDDAVYQVDMSYEEALTLLPFDYE